MYVQVSDRSGGYNVGHNWRPNRTAVGVMLNIERNNTHPDGDMLKLAVHGTLDSLARYRFDFTRSPCPCCNSKNHGKLKLASSGRFRLKALRRKRERNENISRIRER